MAFDPRKAKAEADAEAETVKALDAIILSIESGAPLENQFDCSYE